MIIEKYIDDKLEQVLNVTKMLRIERIMSNVHLSLQNGKNIVFYFETDSSALQGLKLIKEKFKEEKWEEEFEDEMYNLGRYDGGVTLAKQEITEVVEKYLGVSMWNDVKVKVKCKDGMIQIERI